MVRQFESPPFYYIEWVDPPLSYTRQAGGKHRIFSEKMEFIDILTVEIDYIPSIILDIS